jgi:hypothetical protein
MRRQQRRRLLVFIAGVALASSAALASEEIGWWAVHRADAEFDLVAAREAALATVAANPGSADAVAVAAWWFRQLRNLPAPEEILAVAADQRDPELGFQLARIEAALNGRPPVGSLVTAEVAGPFGVFDTLDLERGVAPPDSALPAPETRFTRPWNPVRYTMTTLDGAHSPPEVLDPRGVFVILWTFQIEREFDGWMAIEADGSFDLRVDGRVADQRRFCSTRDARLHWYRVRFERGLHRVRADAASPSQAELRISLMDDQGLAVVPSQAHVSSEGPWAGSEVRTEEPPAMSELLESIDRGGSVDELLLAAAIAERRRDSKRWRAWIERAVEAEPDNPWPRLAMTWYWLSAPSDDDSEAVRRRVREELRRAKAIPLTHFFERGLALRERRPEDDERILNALVDEHGEDVRVIRMWIREALNRGWVREAEDGLRRLQAALPGSRDASETELELLEALERWREREILLRALASAEPVDFLLVDELADGCLVGDAVRIMRRLEDRVEDPDLEVRLVRLLFSAGEREAAAQALDEFQRRWGDLQVVDELRLALTAGDPEASERALADAIERTPSSIELLSLAWRRGRTPFFEPYRLTLDEVLSQTDEADGGVDAVLLLDQAVEKIFDDGSSLYYYHGVTRALTPVGAQQASRLQQLPNSHRLKIRVHKPDGSIVVPATITSGGGPVELEDVAPGDLVEEEYVARVAAAGASRRGHLPPYVYRFADSERAFGLSEYLLLVPRGIELLIEGNMENLERSEWEVDGMRAIRWRAQSVPPIPEERFAPPTSELLPWVSYGFEVTWQDVGDAIRDRLIPLLTTTPELDRWAAPIMGGKAPKDAVTALINGIIDEVDPGRGVLDFAGSPGAAFSRRAGNRLGIAAAVLLADGWQVDLVMARTRPFAGTHLVVPTFDSFLLPLLRVGRDDAEIWLDLEQERQGIGRIDPIVQGSDGLLIPLDRPEEPVTLVRELPSFANLDLEEEMRAEAEVAANGDVRLTVNLAIIGPQAERVLEQIRSVPTERLPMVYQQMAANFVPAASEVTGEIGRIDNGIEVELAMLAPGACRAEGDDLVCRALVFNKPLAPVLAALPARRFPLIMPVPVLQRNELVIDIPEGWKMSAKPRRIETRWGSVHETIERDGQRVRSVLRLELPAQTVQPDDYPDFARFCHAVDELTSRPPVLTR